MGKHIFMTGAAGFIGFHLARHLSQEGNHVIGYDNFNDYYTPKLKRDRAQELAKCGIQVLEGDICDFQTLRSEIENHQTTHLVHLAAQAGVRYSLQNPQAYLKSNMEGFLNVLEVCRASPPLKLIYASSSSVYGLNQKVPFALQDRTDQQASLYGVTKKSNELMAQTYHHLFGFPTVGLRFFTVYGPWGRPDMAYFSFTRSILEGRPIDIYNQGAMKRDFTYIDDIVAGTAAALDYDAKCDVFNLGHHHPEDLLYFIQLLEQELGRKARKNFLPMQPGDVVSTYADIKESEEKLSFKPSVSLEKGIANFINWYKDYYKV
jgi:UDP-glucuronate 4-epimerase